MTFYDFLSVFLWLGWRRSLWLCYEGISGNGFLSGLKNYYWMEEVLIGDGLLMGSFWSEGSSILDSLGRFD
jgi:hypothetical protein